MDRYLDLRKFKIKILEKIIKLFEIFSLESRQVFFMLLVDEIFIFELKPFFFLHKLNLFE